MESRLELRTRVDVSRDQHEIQVISVRSAGVPFKVIQSLDASCYSGSAQHYDEEIKFVIGTRTKSSRPGKKPLEVCIPCLPTNLSLCPKQTLLHCIHCTQELRKSGEQTKSQLFISFVRPHKPVSSSSLGRWINTVMTDYIRFVSNSIIKALHFMSYFLPFLVATVL